MELKFRELKFHLNFMELIKTKKKKKKLHENAVIGF